LELKVQSDLRVIQVHKVLKVVKVHKVPKDLLEIRGLKVL
jgi:hypothetical protein